MPTRTPKRALAAVFAAVALVTSVFAVPGVCAEPPADVVVGFVDRPEPGYYSRTIMPTLADLRGRRMASGGADAVDGWLALAYELKERRLRPEAYRAHTTFLNFPMPDVISAVLSGKVEAGVLSTCMLERAELAGLLKPGALRVVDEKTTQGFSCRHRARRSIPASSWPRSREPLRMSSRQRRSRSSPCPRTPTSPGRSPPTLSQ